MKILFLFTHLFKGGMERVVSNISCVLPNYIEQYVCFFGTEDPGYRYKANMVNFNCPGGKGVGFFYKFYNFIKRIYLLRKFIYINKIDLVISQGDFANIYSLLAMHSAKKILTVHGDFDQFLVQKTLYVRIYFLLIRLLYKYASVIVFVSLELRRKVMLHLNYSVPVAVINNMCDVNLLGFLANESLPEEYLFLNSKRFIVNVGSFCPQKGQDDLIEIFKIINCFYPDLYLLFIGRGEYKDYLNSIVAKYELSNRIVWVDFNNNPFRFMARADVFVLTSRFEGFPNVLIESMACGTPVVAFDCSTGPSEILDDGKWGVLIRNRDKEKMAENILLLLRDSELRARYSRLGLERAKMYSCESIILQWESLFNEL